MGLRVNTNIASLTAQRNLSVSTSKLNRSLDRLSSGLRITRASDDAAGLAISERFRAEIRSLGQAERNANDGVSLLQIAEGALNETSGILVRLRELAVESANGTLGQGERDALNDEFQAQIDEINRIAAVTEFNGTKVLSATGTSITFQIGSNNTTDDQITVTGVDATASGVGVGGLDISSASGASSALASLTTAINQVASLRGQFGAAQNRLESAIRSIQIAIENTSAAESRIRDVDIATETAELTKNQVLQSAGISVLAQANISSNAALKLLPQ